jgi:hypothetical protein
MGEVYERDRLYDLPWCLMLRLLGFG